MPERHERTRRSETRSRRGGEEDRSDACRNLWERRPILVGLAGRESGCRNEPTAAATRRSPGWARGAERQPTPSRSGDRHRGRSGSRGVPAAARHHVPSWNHPKVGRGAWRRKGRRHPMAPNRGAASGAPARGHPPTGPHAGPLTPNHGDPHPGGASHQAPSAQDFRPRECWRTADRGRGGMMGRKAPRRI